MQSLDMYHVAHITIPPAHHVTLCVLHFEIKVPPETELQQW